MLLIRHQLCCLLLLCVVAFSFSHVVSAQANSGAVILQYHHINTRTPAVTSVSPANFQMHMEYLRDNNFQILPLELVIQTLQSGDVLPEKTAVITFDDGYRSVYEVAFPLLKSYGWPFTVFIASGLVSSNAALYSSWDQLREMGNAGATIANHTVSHLYMLDLLEGEDESAWLQRLEFEIEAAEEEIYRQTGQRHKLFGYPYGEYNIPIQELVSRLRYVGLAQHSGPINASSDFTALPRFPFSGVYASMNSYTIKVNSMAFNVSLQSPLTPITSEQSPVAVLDFDDDYNFDALSCFNNDTPMVITKEDVEGNLFRVTTEIKNLTRRFRYNCTAPGSPGRYFWYSIPWINPEVAE